MVAILVSTRIILKNATVRGRDWYKLLDTPVLALHIFLSSWVVSCEVELGGYRSAASDICRFFVRISSGRRFMINTRAQSKLLHTRIILVVVRHHLIQIGRIDGPSEYVSEIFAAIRSTA